MYTNRPNKYKNRTFLEKKFFSKNYQQKIFKKNFYSNIGRFIYQNVQNQILTIFRMNFGLLDPSKKSDLRKTIL